MNEAFHTQEDLPEGYRMTGLGPLPEEWKAVKLGDIFIPVSKKEREQKVLPNTDLRLLTVRLHAKGIVLRPPSSIGVKSEKLYKVKEGDFVFSKIDARNGAWGFVGKELEGALVSGDFPILRLNRELADQAFVALWLSRPSTWTTLRSLSTGTTNRRRTQTRDLLAALSIPLPPLPEQRAIAHVLRAVQEAKEAAERVLSAARALKKSLMRHLFTYGPVPVDRTDQVPMQETELGPLPAHWRVVRLGEVAEIKLGRTPPRQEGRYWQRGEIPWVSIADLNNGVTTETKEKISQEAFEEVFNSSFIPVGTLLLSFKLTIGKVGILGLPAVHNEAIASIFPYGGKVIRDYLFFLFQSMDFDALLDSYVKGKTLNKQKLLLLPIPLPPPEEQQEIARILQAVDEKIRAEEERKEALERLFRSLLHHLMTAKVRLPKAFVERFAEGEP